MMWRSIYTLDLKTSLFHPLPVSSSEYKLLPSNWSWSTTWKEIGKLWYSFYFFYILLQCVGYRWLFKYKLMFCEASYYRWITYQLTWSSLLYILFGRLWLFTILWVGKERMSSKFLWVFIKYNVIIVKSVLSYLVLLLFDASWPLLLDIFLMEIYLLDLNGIFTYIQFILDMLIRDIDLLQLQKTVNPLISPELYILGQIKYVWSCLVPVHINMKNKKDIEFGLMFWVIASIGNINFF